MAEVIRQGGAARHIVAVAQRKAGAGFAVAQRFGRTDAVSAQRAGVFEGALCFRGAKPTIDKAIEGVGQAKLLDHERVFPHLEAANGVPIFENLTAFRGKAPRQLLHKLFHCRRHLGCDGFAIAQRTGERIDPARPGAHSAQRPSQFAFEESGVSNIERANDVSGEFPIAEAFRLRQHAVVVAHLGQAHHLSAIFEHRNPKVPILSRFDLLTITSDAVEVFASVERAGRNVVAACQESEREIGEVPATTASADEINRGAHDFHLRLLFQHGDSVCNKGQSEQVVGIHRQNVATSRGDHRHIACATGTRVRLAEQTDATIGLRQRFHDLG